MNDEETKRKLRILRDGTHVQSTMKLRNGYIPRIMIMDSIPRKKLTSCQKAYKVDSLHIFFNNIDRAKKNTSMPYHHKHVHSH